ncbi:hypothetical protein BDN72DRAFT_906931 [Pluteus cervinus]|uniref:Uncharacterized protein n=1 Tax=Pluteus cervinus TaxID=181527 RepID=A0ACD2ZY33_9AGAR|nr:hypothetical protein BDN72DRAFT_906931 [Pluteus cervinus]
MLLPSASVLSTAIPFSNAVVVTLNGVPAPSNTVIGAQESLVDISAVGINADGATTYIIEWVDFGATNLPNPSADASLVPAGSFFFTGTLVEGASSLILNRPIMEFVACPSPVPGCLQNNKQVSITCTFDSDGNGSCVQVQEDLGSGPPGPFTTTSWTGPVVPSITATVNSPPPHQAGSTGPTPQQTGSTSASSNLRAGRSGWMLCSLGLAVSLAHFF